ncbi:MAG TPA: transposase [Thermoanaerobaculia bacterium]|nr:transposase [Thermoanaerobaculia bacterium]
MIEDGFFDPRKPFHIRWGNLPHWRQDGALYFVTFRLGDSLPQSKLTAWLRERDEWRRLHPDARADEIEEFSLRQRREIEVWLDRGIGSRVLRIPAAKTIVEDAFRHFDGERYELGEFAVAANHAHALARTASGIDLSEVLHSWKRHSSREISKLDEVKRVLPGARRHLWQVESFDHIVRNRASLEKFTRYIRNHRA